MKKLVIATAAVLGLGIAIPAHAASEIDCMVMWEKADVNKNWHSGRQSGDRLLGRDQKERQEV